MCPCIVESALRKTSKTYLKVNTGEIESCDVIADTPNTHAFAMTSESHAQQVFDHIAAGNFHMLTDDVRHYIDHDYPFGGLTSVGRTYEE